MRVVLDTSVLISALFWRGASHGILKLAENKKIETCASPEMLEELQGVLERPKFKKFINRRRTSVQELMLKTIELVSIFLTAAKPEDIIEGLEDQDDVMFLHLAECSSASYLVSGDKHLLKMKNWKNTKIVSPAQFIRLWRSRV